MQPITGRAGHRAAGHPQRRTSPPVSRDAATDALADELPTAPAASDTWGLRSEDPLADLREDDLSEEDRKGDADADNGSRRPGPGRSVLLPLAAAVVLALVGAVCLLPVRLPWEAPTRPATAPSAKHRGTTPPMSDTGSSSASLNSSAPTSPVEGWRPALPPAASTTNEVTPAAPTPTPTPTPATTADADTPSTPTPEDTLAGPVSDQVLQDLLISSLPPDRTITDPAMLSSPDSQKLLEVAWEALASDVEAGGWTQPRQQAHAVLRTGRDNTQAMPIVVDVVVMWAAFDGQGELTERELSTVRVSKGGGSWTAGKITTASEEN